MQGIGQLRCIGGTASGGHCVGVRAAASALMLLCVAPARADTVGPDERPFLFFAGTDLWRDGAFLHGGALWSPGGFDADGFTGLRAQMQPTLTVFVEFYPVANRLLKEENYIVISNN